MAVFFLDIVGYRNLAGIAAFFGYRLDIAFLWISLVWLRWFITATAFEMVHEHSLGWWDGGAQFIPVSFITYDETKYETQKQKTVDGSLLLWMGWVGWVVGIRIGRVDVLIL
jgi:hypothetical protein